MKKHQLVVALCICLFLLELTCADYIYHPPCIRWGRRRRGTCIRRGILRPGRRPRYRLRILTGKSIGNENQLIQEDQVRREAMQSLLDSISDEMD